MSCHVIPCLNDNYVGIINPQGRDPSPPISIVIFVFQTRDLARSADVAT